jgi:hypothetical protein
MNRPNISVSYSWRLPSGDAALARRIVEQLRERAAQVGLQSVSELVVLGGEEAERDQRLPRQYVWSPDGGDRPLRPAEVVFFTATLPGGERASFGLGKYQGTEDDGWSWGGVARTFDLRTFDNFSLAAAELGVEVQEVFAGVVFTHKRDATGEVQTVQRRRWGRRSTPIPSEVGMSHHLDQRRELALLVLASLRVGNPPWRFPFSRQPPFAPLFGRYGTGQPPAAGKVDYGMAETVIQATGAKISHHRRCQRPRCDRPPFERILLPPRSSFLNDAQYVATKLHEVIHYVEQPWRAGWVGSDHQGELVAECGTGFLEAALGLPHDDDNTNVEKWLPTWAEEIEKSPDYLLDAVAQAVRSVEFILGLYRQSLDRERAAGKPGVGVVRNGPCMVLETADSALHN